MLTRVFDAAEFVAALEGHGIKAQVAEEISGSAVDIRTTSGRDLRWRKNSKGPSA